MSSSALVRFSLRSSLRFAGVAVVVGIVTACSSSSTPSPSSAPSSSNSSAPAASASLTVVASTTVFADMVRNVGGDRISVASLVPANGDVHTFEPRPSDVRTLAGASLIVMNGLGLDDWLDKTVGNAAPRATVVKLGVDLPGATYVVGEEASGPPNPHLWMNVQYAIGYVDRIAAALKQADPADSATFDANAAAYKQTLTTLDGWVKDQIGSIPQDNRKFVSFHDAFPYYAAAYGLTIVGVAVEAPGQDPSAAYTAQLIDAIKQAHVKAIFSEAQFPAKLVDQLASATGASVVSDLYDDAIGDPPITSYEAIIRWDTDQFVKALK